jgi:Ca2+-binding RTX toxin-like protein
VAAAALIVCALWPPGAARAATVTVHYGGGGEKAQYPTVATVTVAGTGGPDDLQVTVQPGAVDVVDALRPAVVAAGTPCAAIDEHHVHCVPRGSSIDAIVRAGAGDDRITVDGALAEGGPGDDVLLGGAGPDRLSGGPGTDVVSGGAGDDQLIYGPGDLGSGEMADGGSGSDAVSVAGATTPVDVDLAAGQATWAGGRLALVSIEDAGADGPAATLLGDDGANWLWVAGHGVVDGRGGDDRIADQAAGAEAHADATLRGGAGNDTLLWAPGDAVDGGAGNDRLASYSNRGLWRAAPRHMVCGTGFDVADYFSDRLTRPLDCELTNVLGPGAVGPVVARTDALVLTLAPDSNVCGLRVRAVAPLGGRTLTATARVRPGAGTLTIRLPLTATGRRVLDTPHRQNVTLVLRSYRRCRGERWHNALDGRLTTAVGRPGRSAREAGTEPMT